MATTPTRPDQPERVDLTDALIAAVSALHGQAWEARDKAAWWRERAADESDPEHRAWKEEQAAGWDQIARRAVVAADVLSDHRVSVRIAEPRAR